MEPQRIYLTSDLPVSLRAHRKSVDEEHEVKNQIKSLLETGIIKKSHSSYSVHVTLAKKRDELEKIKCYN